MTNKVLLVYDGECPLCRNYCQMVQIQQSVGELVLIDARLQSDVMREISDKELDIDQGMVLKLNGIIYYASDAVHMLSLISSKNGIFNRFNFWLFSSKQISYWLYPLLKFCRNLTLKALGKRKINNLQMNNNSHF